MVVLGLAHGLVFLPALALVAEGRAAHCDEHALPTGPVDDEAAGRPGSHAAGDLRHLRRDVGRRRGPRTRVCDRTRTLSDLRPSISTRSEFFNIYAFTSSQNKKRKKFDNTMDDIPATEDFLVK